MLVVIVVKLIFKFVQSINCIHCVYIRDFSIASNGIRNILNLKCQKHHCIKILSLNLIQSTSNNIKTVRLRQILCVLGA